MYYLSNLHVNSILTGSLDSYCLVCDNYLRSEDEAFVHTEKPIHRKNLDAAIRLEKYKDDQIIKVKKGYYCIFCNILLSTTTKVGLHISNIKHKENKRVQMLHRVGNIVVAFDEVAINLEAWHGVMENTCVICNAEFETDDHSSDQSHVVKLIQSKCEFGDKYVYRKVDEESFFCLICGSVYSISDKPTHHEDTEHSMHYDSGKALKSKTPITEPKAKKTKPGPEQNFACEKSMDMSKCINSESSQKAKENHKIVKTNTDQFPKIKTNETPEGKRTELIDATKIEQVTLKKTDKFNAEIEAKEGAEQDEFYKGTANSTSQGQNNYNTSKSSNSSKVMQYLNKNDYIIEYDINQFKCHLCDLDCMFVEDIKPHLDDFHHKTMLKKHTETLRKRVLSSERIQKESDMHGKSGEKSNVKQPETLACKDSESTLKTTEKCQQKEVKSTPAEIQLKRKEQKMDKCLITENDDKSKILENVERFQNNGITINFIYEKAHCKRCKNSLEFDYMILERHVKECHSEIVDSTIEKNTKSQIDAFIAGNYMITKKNEAYCNLCSIGINKTLKDLTAHVNTTTHKTNVFYKKGPSSDLVKKVKTAQYIYHFCRVDTNIGSDVVLNHSFVLTHYSFQCVSVALEGWSCILCKAHFLWSGDQLNQHLNSDEHKTKIGDTDIVVSFKDEFVREISAGVYHCGFCDVVIDQWLALEVHFATSTHIVSRRNAEWNLHRWQAVVRNARPQHVSNLHAVNFV